jgi:transposase
VKFSDRAGIISDWVGRIRKSHLSVQRYFRRFKVPFTRRQYFRYKRKLQQQGVSGLRDGRAGGNHRKLSPEAEGFLAGYLRTHPEVSLGELQRLAERRFDTTVTKSAVSQCLKRLGLSPTRRRAPAVQREHTAFGGFELVVALACHLRWPQTTAEIIRRQIERLQRSRAHGWDRPIDRRGRDSRGRFTPHYNRRKDVRESRFASIEQKRGAKNFASMSIARVDPQVLARKSLAALALPLVTRQGMSRSVDTPLGESLRSVCGFNYKNETLRKFFSELKYLGVAESLLRGQVPYWQRQWKGTSRGALELPLLCYYVDGHTKAYWSSRRVRQNKVTMLGRVMGCLEQVFVHDQFGRPLYFETYAGHAPLGEQVLSLFEKIEGSLEAPPNRLQVTRAIIIDGVGNSVRTLRAFTAQRHYHYITSLDTNQWNPRKIRREGRARRYAYGPATLRDCELELEDSHEPGYLIVTRAIKIGWDYGRVTVLITSLPEGTIGPSEVVKAYFDRWPAQELSFKVMKHVACLNRVAGYGKQRIDDTNVSRRQQKLAGEITALRSRLDSPLEAIAREESRLSALIRRERLLRARSRIRDGRRLLPKQDVQRLTTIGKDIGRVQRAIKRSEKHTPALRRLRKKEREWLRLQSKQTVYHADVELDQIATYFRVAFTNLCAYLLGEYFGSSPLSLGRFVEHVLHIPATIEHTDTTKRVLLHLGQKDRATSIALGPVMARINSLNGVNLAGQRIIFELSSRGDI